MSALLAPPAPLKHKMHVNVRMMKFNQETGSDEPTLVVLPACPEGGEQQTIYAKEVILRDRKGNEVARLVNRPNDRLPGGAQAWIETDLIVECVGDQTVLALQPNV